MHPASMHVSRILLGFYLEKPVANAPVFLLSDIYKIKLDMTALVHPCTRGISTAVYVKRVSAGGSERVGVLLFM